MKKNKSKLETLGTMLNEYHFYGNLPKCCSMADMATLQCCYNELSENGKPEFVQSNVKTILENIGYIVAPYKIGYKVIA